MIGERGRILTRPLTQEEQKLCEEHHDIIYQVMKQYRFADPGLDVYGEFALSLMDAAQKYTTSNRLRKFRFSAIAYQHLRNRVSSLLIESNKHPSLSFDAPCLDDDDTYGDRTPTCNFRPHASKTTLALYVQCIERLTPKQYEALRMYGNGMTYSEIAAALGISSSTVSSRISAGRRQCLHSHSVPND